MNKLNGKSKGQAAIETITILGFIIFFSIPLMLVLLNVNSDEASIEQAGTTVNILTDAVNTVYMQGEGAQKIVLVPYPERLINITFAESNNPTLDGLSEIILTLRSQGGPVDVVGITVAPINVDDSDMLKGNYGAGLQRVKISFPPGEDKIKLIAVEGD